MSAYENIAIKDISSGNDLIITAAGAAKVDGSAVVQPVSGTVTIVPSGTQNVNILSSVSITVTATNLDIRDLLHTQDSIRIGDGTDLANVTALGELNVLATAQPGVDIGDVTINNGAGAAAVNIQDGGNSITVDGPLTDAELRATPVPVSATNLDIRDLVFASDKVDVSGSSVIISSAALPTGAATAANQLTIIGHVDGLEGLLTTIDADTSNISTKIDTIAGAVSGSEMQVDIVSMPTVTVTATNLDIRDLVFATDKVDISGSILGANSGVDIGDVTINNGSGAAAVNIQDGGNSITVDGTVTVTGVATEATLASLLTSSQLIDDAIVTLGTSTYTEATSKAQVIGAVRRDADTTLVNTTNEFGPLQMDANGRLKVEAFSGETLPVSLASTTITGTVAVTQSGTWDEVGINDSGNSITVDAPVGTPVNVQIGDGTRTATVRDTGASDSLNVAIVDASGNQITSFGGGTQYTEGDTDATIVGTAMLMEGAGDTLVPAQGTVADGLLVNLGANNDVTVTGSVTANAGTNLNTSALALETTATAIKTAVEIIDNAISGSEMQVDIVASLPAGTNNIGDVDVLTLPSIPAGTNNIGDVDIASIAAGNNVIGQVKLTDGTDVADILDLPNSNPLTVAIVDANGDQISSFGGGTQYTEDAAAAANPVGNAVILVRSDTPGALVTTDGDNVAQRGTNYGAAYSQIVTSSGAFVDTFGGGTQYTEDVASVADPVGNQLIARRRDALGAETTTDGDNVAVNSTNKGELYVKHVDSIPVTDNGASLTVDATNLDIRDLTFAADKVDASGTVLGAGTNNIGDVDVLTLPAITGTVTANAGTNLNTSALALEATLQSVKTAVEIIDNAIAGSEMQVDIVGALPAGNNNIGDVDIASIAAGTNHIGNVGHGKTLKTVTSGVTPITADTDLIALVAAKRLKVISYAFFTDSITQNILVLKSNGTGGTALWTVPLQSPQAGAIFGANLATEAPSFLFATVAGEKLTVDVSAAVNVWYSLTYYDDDAN